MRKLASSTEKGFGLIESMVALAILTISLLGLVQLIATALNQSALARNNTMAISIAQEKLEQLRTAYNNDLNTGTSSTDLTAGSHGPETVTLQAPSYSNMADQPFQVSWTVAVSGQQKTVTATVVPQNQNQMQSTSLSIITVFAP
ncbi:prepilin-type N-terminal cleavage/methylation domain-containing protein [Acidobacteria bacterium AH-259-A15]|nr:prepilin-type N-terminal cleavage/methylation domain-containing protein [Acidobacteria bacterium AH-259-A15]